MPDAPTAPPSVAAAAQPPRPAPPDARVAGLVAAAQADLEACRCVAAERALAALETLRGGPPRALALRPALRACRPIDVDHRCVAGKLVRAE